MTRTLVVVFLFAVLLATIGVGVAASRFQLASETSQPVKCVADVETREHVRAVFLDALDFALKDHIARMYEVWMKDERDQPRRAETGARQGLKAYLAGRAAAQKWNPPLC